MVASDLDSRVLEIDLKGVTTKQALVVRTRELHFTPHERQLPLLLANVSRVPIRCTFRASVGGLNFPSVVNLPSESESEIKITVSSDTAARTEGVLEVVSDKTITQIPVKVD